MDNSEALFWADRFAEKISKREKFRFVEKHVSKAGLWRVKSSSSLSGVLHIGRLSDIIRGEAVYLALKEIGFPVEFIYVTEDMDPLRKVPECVPKSFEEYIGFSVSDVPDPDGCHKSYAEHHLGVFLKTMSGFLSSEPEIFSMRQEYKNGNFTESILDLVKNSEKAKEIISRVQGSDLGEGWFPWKPICDNCGNLQTTVVLGIDGNTARYACRDYAFEKHTAKGCGFEGVQDLKKANGKLVWKSEWAAQWKRWNVCSEGAGKEYESGNSAFWVNAEICEKVLNFPMPEPVFYEHLMIDGKKMSASVGNVVFPWQWLEVARPESLKLSYMKKIMKSRSFSWHDVPVIELELDRAVETEYSEKIDFKDEKETIQLKKLYKYSRVGSRELLPLPVDYSFAVLLVQLFKENSQIVSRLVESNIVSASDVERVLPQLLERFGNARLWVEKYAPENVKISFLEKISHSDVAGISPIVKKGFGEIASELLPLENPDEIQSAVFNTAKRLGLAMPEVFRAIYSVLIGKTAGPKVGLLFVALGKNKCVERLKEVSRM